MLVEITFSAEQTARQLQHFKVAARPTEPSNATPNFLKGLEKKKGNSKFTSYREGNLFFHAELMLRLSSGHQKGVCVLSLGTGNTTLGPDDSSYSHTDCCFKL